jgi:hypothetical protein
MAKRKKTLQDKKLADARHQFVHKDISMPIKLEAHPVPVITATPVQKTNSISLYPAAFLIHDLRKTGILTLSIIAAQLILFFILKNHIISITWLAY